MSNDPFEIFATTFPYFPGAMCASGIVDPDLWFPEFIRNPAERAKTIENAKAICNGCAYKTDCLQFALDNEIGDGIWGGVLPEQRTIRELKKNSHAKRQQKFDEVRMLLDRGMTLEDACKDVGIKKDTFERYKYFDFLN